jgi:hypothetical protein
MFYGIFKVKKNDIEENPEQCNCYNRKSRDGKKFICHMQYAPDDTPIKILPLETNREEPTEGKARHEMRKAEWSGEE